MYLITHCCRRTAPLGKMVMGKTQLFPDTYLLEFEVDSTLANGDFAGHNIQ